MSGLARANGWRGFDGIATKVDGGWHYGCDGMPSMMGCGAAVTVARRWSKVGVKKSGWLVCYGLESIDSSKPMADPANQVEDEDVVLTYCPDCAAVVRAQTKAAEHA